MKKSELTGIILSGGKSSRMGSEKGLMIYNERPLIWYSIKALEPLCGQIIVSANSELEKYKLFGLPVIQDKMKEIGPMGGLISCLQFSQTSHNLVLSCDMPHIISQVFDYLIDRIENFQVVIPIHKNNLLEPLCGYYNTNVITMLEESVKIGNYKMSNFLETIRLKTILIDNDFPFFGETLFENFNSAYQLREKFNL